jgi:acetate kinase
MKVLVLNSGSSSQKMCLYEIGEVLPLDPSTCVWEARVEWEGTNCAMVTRNAGGHTQRAEVQVGSRTEALKQLLATLWAGEDRVVSTVKDIAVVGHRVVHGGPEYEAPAFITEDVKAGIAAASAFAPLHNRAELEGMDTVEQLMGDVPQVAVFDTGFHRKMPLPAVVYPGPYKWFEQGIRRYGFHGINHQYCAERAAQLLGKSLKSLRVVSCHLGNGCSLAAIRDGHSIDTTMGFTPLEGLMMGTRSGSVDPGILTYLMRRDQATGEQIDDVLNKQSGLMGVSGISGDMRHILAAIQEGSERAKLAFDIYIHRLQSGIGSMVAVMGGLDALVFTAGVGENSAEVREATCSNLEFLGVKLDEKMNAKPRWDADIAAVDSKVRVLVIRAQEDWAIARECWMLARNRQAAE